MHERQDRHERNIKHAIAHMAVYIGIHGRYMLYMKQGGLTLPDATYYLDNDMSPHLDSLHRAITKFFSPTGPTLP